MARHFNRPDRHRMLEEVSSLEMTEWMAYLELLVEEDKERDKKPGKSGQKPIDPKTLSALPKGTHMLPG